MRVVSNLSTLPEKNTGVFPRMSRRKKKEMGSKIYSDDTVESVSFICTGGMKSMMYVPWLEDREHDVSQTAVKTQVETS